MNTAIVYLAYRFFYRAMEFFRHWYVDLPRWLGRKWVETMEHMDQGFAVRITLRHFFEPLYNDYSFIGRILGVIFRSGRILLGSVFYFITTLIFAAVFLVLVAVPPAIIMLIYVYWNLD